MKTSKITSIFLGVGLLLSTHITHAAFAMNQTDSDRAKQVAELLIALYAQAPHDPTWVNIQFGAAIAGISVNEASALPRIPSPTSMAEAALSAPYTAQEMAKVAPVIDQQMSIQSNIAKSCKLNGEMTQPTKTSYEFPVSCQIPVVDWKALQKPVANPKMSDAKNFITMLNWVNAVMLKAPQQNINTFIRLDQIGNRLIPNITDGKYFPVSLTLAISNVSEERQGKQRLRLGP